MVGLRRLSGTTEDPMAVWGCSGGCTGARSSLLPTRSSPAATPVIVCAKLEGVVPRGMRASALTIVHEGGADCLQRAYAGLDPDARMLAYPGCVFRQPPTAGDRYAPGLPVAFSG